MKDDLEMTQKSLKEKNTNFGLGAIAHTRKQRWPRENTKIICKNGTKRQIHKL